MASNIEKLLEHLVKIDGERLVIGISEPIYVLKNGAKSQVMGQVLSETQFNFIEKEYSRIFADQEEFTYQGMPIRTVRGDFQREFFKHSPQPAFDAPPEPFAEQSLPPQPPAGPPPVPGPPQPEPFMQQPPPVPVQEDSPPPPSPEPVAPQQDQTGLSGEFLETLLHLMIERGASDLHTSSKCKPMLRVDGDMVSLDDWPDVTTDDLWREVKRIAPERNVKEFEETNDTDFAYSIPNLARFRANVFRDLAGIGAVFRVIPSEILTVEQLNVPKAMVDLCKIPKGLILVTGPTGSGKSTTLAALINEINETQKKHIITIEDPVEFVHPNKLSLVNQREINTHTQSFKRSLRAALREDPDIILVGEMRDLETIAIAIEMAVTGHLVFGTLHTSTAIGTVDRIIDQFPADQQQQIRAMLSDALIGVCAQALLKRKEKGRVGAYEILVVTPAVSNLIREGKNYQIGTLMQTGRSLGMQMINTHMLELVDSGIVAPEEALAKAIDKENMRTLLRGKGHLND